MSAREKVIMKRIYHKAKNFKDAENWDILQQINMTPENRQRAAEELRKRVYGVKTIDLKQAHSKK